MERTSLKSLVVTWLILFLVGCASSPSVKLNARGQSELQVAILNDDINTALRIIENGSIFDVMYIGWEPTAPALALAHDDPRMIESMVRRFGPEHMFLNWSWVEYHEAACEYFARLDASPTLRPLLREMARPEEACPKQDTTFAALVRRNAASLSEETLTWALGDGYQQQLLFALKADPQSAIPMLAEQSPEELGFSNQDALVAAQIGGHRAAIERIIEYGADPDLIGSEQWGEILCESLEIGSHEQDVLIEQLKAHAQRSGPCGAYWHTALWDDRMAFFDATLTAGLYESNELENILETAEFKKNVPAMAIIAKHFGLSSLTPSAQKTILDSSEGKKVLYASLDDDAKHEFACRLLAIPRSLHSVEREMVEESVVLARRCEGGQLPIMVASAVPDNFEFVYNLDPKVYRRSTTKATVLKAALATGDPSIILPVADHSLELIPGLARADVGAVINQPELLAQLESRGLPKEFRTYAGIASLCSQAKLEANTAPLYQSFFMAYRGLFEEYEEKDELRDMALDSYISCLDTKSKELVASNLFRNSYKDRPDLSRGIFLKAKAESLMALSMLAYRDVSKQRAEQASELLISSYQSVQDMVSLYEKEVEDYVVYQRKEIERRYQLAKKRKDEGEDRALGGALLAGGVILAGSAFMASEGVDPSGTLETSLTQIFSQYQSAQKMVESDYRDTINSLAKVKLDIPKVEGLLADKLDSDGIRLLVPRYGRKDHHGSLLAGSGYDPTNSTVRIVVDFPGGSGRVCSGIVIQTGRILTTKNCIVEGGDMVLARKVTAKYEYLSANSEAIVVSNREYGSSSGEAWNVLMPKDHYNPRFGGDWKNNWAILEATPTQGRVLPQFLKTNFMPMMTWDETTAYLKSGGRVTLAGYATHLNEGRFLTMDWGCGILRAKPEKMITECKGWAGDGGAAVTATDGDLKGKTIAIHSLSNQSSESPESGEVMAAYIMDEIKSGRYHATKI